MELPSGDELGDECPFVAMLGVEMNEIILLDETPPVFVDASFEMVVVSLPALLAVPVLNTVLDLHNFGDLTPFFNFPLFKDFFENLVFLR